MWIHLLILFTAGFVFTGCSTPPSKTPPVPEEIPGNQIRMDFSRQDGLFRAPFPAEDLRTDNDRIALTAFPNPHHIEFVQSLLAIVQKDARGFGLSSAIYFTLTEDLDSQQLPHWKQTVTPSSPVILLGIEKQAPDYLRQYPVSVRYESDGGPFGDKKLLSLLPLQGIPLRPNTLYAAAIFRSLKDTKGQPLGMSLTMAQLIAQTKPPQLSERVYTLFQTALQALQEAKHDTKQLAGLTVFRTDDPALTMRQAYAFLQKQPVPTWEQAWKQTEMFPEYCVYENTLKMPIFQQGKPPFQSTPQGDAGGAWRFRTDGTLEQQGTETARILLTIPRKTMPTGGYPVVTLIRTGAGGDRPLVERGVRAKAGGEAIEKGSGPARNFAKAGFAGVSIDGPHGGLRNITKGDEQFLIFNITNPIAMRDNVRQSALELTLIPRLLSSLKLDITACTDAVAPSQRATFDSQKLVLMGHSMGATIAPLVAAVEPAFRGIILSGAGGSWIENIVYKRSPLEVRPLAEAILLYTSINRTLHTHDPVLSLLQWGGEASDPPLYARYLLQDTGTTQPRHILMLQGIVDTYIMPSIANALSLALGLDLAGSSLDRTESRLKDFTPLDEFLPLLSKKQLEFPVQGNYKSQLPATTAIVTQHPQDTVEDGHEVVFQTPGPKHQYRCFLESLAQNKIPWIPKPGQEWDPCPIP